MLSRVLGVGRAPANARAAEVGVTASRVWLAAGAVPTAQSGAVGPRPSLACQPTRSVSAIAARGLCPAPPRRLPAGLALNNGSVAAGLASRAAVGISSRRFLKDLNETEATDAQARDELIKERAALNKTSLATLVASSMPSKRGKRLGNEAGNDKIFVDEETPVQDKPVLIIYTGGTVGMRISATTGAWVPEAGYLTQELEDLRVLKPGLPEFKVLEYDPLIDSSDMQPGNWVEIATDIYRHYEDYCGFVVIHGTDTMSYSASALSFMLQNLAKPVVFTGSCVPICELYNDAERNLVVSLLIAAYSQIPEVCVFFDDELFRGNRSTKIDSFGLTGFASPNIGPLGYLGNKITLKRSRVLPMPVVERGGLLADFNVHLNLSNDVVALTLLPGMTNAPLEGIANRSDIKGLILLAFGTGNASASHGELLTLLEKIIANGTTVVVLTQCPKGLVNLDQYSTGRALHDIGVVSGYDMTTEAACAKLSYLIGNGYTGKTLKRMIEMPLAGELTRHVGHEDVRDMQVKRVQGAGKPQ